MLQSCQPRTNWRCDHAGGPLQRNQDKIEVNLRSGGIDLWREEAKSGRH